MLAVAAGTGAFVGLRGEAGSGPSSAGASRSVQPVTAPRATSNGEIDIMALPVDSRMQGPPGWYGLSSIGSDGELQTVVRCPHRVDFCGEVQSIDWSPNGRWLALSVTSFGRANPYNGIRVVNPATGADLGLRGCNETPGECDWFDLDWSPDGTRLAYVALGSISILDIAREPASAARPLWTETAARDSSPSWSPDGRWIAYDSAVDGESRVSVIPAEGGTPRVLAIGASSPAWSPDGRRIAVRRGWFGFRLLTPTGADVTPPGLSGGLLNFPGRKRPRIGPPVWSPDGSKIAFSAYGGRSAPFTSHADGTYVMNADGSGRTRITTEALGVVVGQEPRPAWRPVP